eukprot:CAMPEP_0118684646 /NCGR_PEP_ID=MMETSP0800-20121206/6772_1 /TAXON_ID=210618 ORGANISM="Striatella unipunctata, Strain CCMP2910" /NCGR_SAMPLE_ID=MMETSP0800 /ASSEMBLY_ACC=CAM_ASM_000638 /LENGTH=412 /DNA_ID=CAMNT_0006581401 /DNA_START=58 /DNA_END=1296 /DNA_ORIENTATION=+
MRFPMGTKAVLLITTVGTAGAFQCSSFMKTQSSVRRSQHHSATDSPIATKKEYDEVLGSDFEVETVEKRKEKRRNLLYPKHVEVIEDFSHVVERMVDGVLLETGEKSWQPQDFLPDLTKENWVEEIKDLREQASQIPDELLIVLVGDMVTEEALPTYQTLLNTFEGCDDPTGTTDSAWARWSRGWTSEENRHGDLLNKYLYLGGRCDMRSIEVTIQHLITNGFDPGAEQDPYRGFVYTSFQERATKISHGNVGKLAGQNGDTNLQKICAKIAGDEGRHERAYQTFVKEILKRDPDGLLEVFGEMMRESISMPAELMTDGEDENLYDSFSAVAQKLGVYTAIDYADIIDHLVKTWDLANLSGLSAEAEQERDYLCRLPGRYRKLAERSMNRARKAAKDDIATHSFNWIYGRAV